MNRPAARNLTPQGPGHPPGALPNIFTGLRLAAGTALILVFITEMEATT